MKINKKDVLGRHVRRKVNKRYIFGKISERVGENWLVSYAFTLDIDSRLHLRLSILMETKRK